MNHTVNVLESQHKATVRRLVKSPEKLVAEIKRHELLELLHVCSSFVTVGNVLDLHKKSIIYRKEVNGLAGFGSPDWAEKVTLSDGVALTPEKAALLHAAIGIAGEAAEILDAVCSFVSGHSEKLDFPNVLEESGDLEFYHEDLRFNVGFSREEALMHNNDKLATRYPEGYTDQAAQERADKK